jgi:hypothetical protein
LIEQPTQKVIEQTTGELIDRLLLERISLAGIAFATKVCSHCSQTFVNEKYAQVPRKIQVIPIHLKSELFNLELSLLDILLGFNLGH